jgi:hypothetical protein
LEGHDERVYVKIKQGCCRYESLGTATGRVPT